MYECGSGVLPLQNLTGSEMDLAKPILVTGATGKITNVKKTMIALPVSNAGSAGVAAVA